MAKKKRQRDKPKKTVKPIGPEPKPESEYGCDPFAALENPKRKRRYVTRGTLR